MTTDTRLQDVTIGIVLLVLVGLTAAGGVAQAQQTDSPLALSASATETEPGGETTLSITVENTGSDRVTAPVVGVESLPPGWEVVNATSDGAAYRNATNEFLWVGVGPDATVEATATLAVPENASGSRTIQLEVTDADGNVDQATAQVQIQNDSGSPSLLTNPFVLVGVAAALVVGGWLYRTRSGRQNGPQQGPPRNQTETASQHAGSGESESSPQDDSDRAE